MQSVCGEYALETEGIGVDVIAEDLAHFGNEPSARATLKLNDDVERVRYITFHSSVWQL